MMDVCKKRERERLEMAELRFLKAVAGHRMADLGDEEYIKEKLGDRGWIPGEGCEFFSSTQCPDRL
jgi:hypothetical protein